MSDAQQTPPGTRDQGTIRHRDEKDEKDRQQSEKDREKHEKSQPDTLSSILWALFLICVGVLLLVQQFIPLRWEWSGGSWSLIMVLAGCFLLLEAVIRLLVPAYRRPVLGTIIGGVILLSIGTGGFFGFQLIWPLILIILGVAIIAGGLFRGRF